MQVKCFTFTQTSYQQKIILLILTLHQRLKKLTRLHRSMKLTPYLRYQVYLVCSTHKCVGHRIIKVLKLIFIRREGLDHSSQILYRCKQNVGAICLSSYNVLAGTKTTSCVISASNNRPHNITFVQSKTHSLFQLETRTTSYLNNYMRTFTNNKINPNISLKQQ